MAERDGEAMHVDDNSLNTRQLEDKLLDRVAKSDAYFKSQQLGDPDLTFEEKRRIAGDLLDDSPARFLARFHKYLKPGDEALFHPFKGDYEVDFYLKESAVADDRRRRRVQVKNRRYKALRQLADKGDYFSDAEMKTRNPLLFEQMIGQYMTEEEKEQMEQIEKSDLRFSSILLEHIDRTNIDKLKKIQSEQEDDQLEESDSDEDSNESEVDENIQDKISDEEKHMLRQEFVSNMHESFLMGKDADFDYSNVDDNEDYDDIECDGDVEANYFDSEEPSSEQPTDISDPVLESVIGVNL